MLQTKIGRNKLWVQRKLGAAKLGAAKIGRSTKIGRSENWAQRGCAQNVVAQFFFCVKFLLRPILLRPNLVCFAPKFRGTQLLHVVMANVFGC